MVAGEQEVNTERLAFVTSAIVSLSAVQAPPPAMKREGPLGAAELGVARWAGGPAPGHCFPSQVGARSVLIK